MSLSFLSLLNSLALLTQTPTTPLWQPSVCSQYPWVCLSYFQVATTIKINFHFLEYPEVYLCPFSFSWGSNKELHKSFYTYMSSSILAHSNGNSGLHLPFLFDQSWGRSRAYGLPCSLQVTLFGNLISCWVYCSHPLYQWHLLQHNLVFGHFLSVNIQHRLCCTQ